MAAVLAAALFSYRIYYYNALYHSTLPGVVESVGDTKAHRMNLVIDMDVLRAAAARLREQVCAAVVGEPVLEFERQVVPKHVLHAAADEVAAEVLFNALEIDLRAGVAGGHIPQRAAGAGQTQPAANRPGIIVAQAELGGAGKVESKGRLLLTERIVGEGAQENAACNLSIQAYNNGSSEALTAQVVAVSSAHKPSGVPLVELRGRKPVADRGANVESLPVCLAAL